MEKIFVTIIDKASKIPVYFAAFVILCGMIFGTLDLLYILWTASIKPTYFPFAIPVVELMKLFNFALIIVVGYELIKSVLLIIKSDFIPVDAIAKIAGIAVLNKIVTSDYGDMDYLKIISMGFIMISISISYYLFTHSHR